MSHTIIAADEEDARYEARKAHYLRAGWNCSIWIKSIQEV